MARCGPGGVRAWGVAPSCGARYADRKAGGCLDCKLGVGNGEERTANMPNMVVTLEVSKFSGWLNAAALRNM